MHSLCSLSLTLHYTCVKEAHSLRWLSVTFHTKIALHSSIDSFWFNLCQLILLVLLLVTMIIVCRAKACIVIFYLIYLLVIFALFGTSASYFARFIYLYWFRNELDESLILKAGGCALLIMTLSIIGAITFSS